MGLHDLRRLHGALPGLHRACAADRRHAAQPGAGAERVPGRTDQRLQQPGTRSTARTQFPPTQRDAWTKKWPSRCGTMAEAAAAEEPVEVLFFVGCLGSFDSRNQRTTLALARILQAAGDQLRHPGQGRDLHRRSGAPHRQRVSGADDGAADGRDAQPYTLQEDRDGLPALLQHDQERVPADRRQLRGRPPHASSSAS